MCNWTKHGNTVFLWNAKYPYAVEACTTTSGCICTVSASGNSRIQIDAFDIRFQANATTMRCAQRIYIQDGGTKFDVACDDYNAFERRMIYFSATNSIKMRFDNTLNTKNGYFWIQLKGMKNIMLLLFRVLMYCLQI